MDTTDPSPRSREVDLTRAPLGVKAASALVAAIAASDDRVERYYLEVKSDLNLSQKNDVAKIAKFILGSANRLPSVASAAFEGYGVMVIGVAPGEVRGVPPVEVLELDKVIGQYLGVTGPRWDVVRVPITGSTNEVLVVVVDPPEDGQDPFLCRKEGENLYNGRVYVRADGETREAKAEELDLLLKRGKYQAAPDVSFEVDVAGMAYPVSLDDARTADAYIAQTKQRLLAALPQQEPEPEEGRSDVFDAARASIVGPNMAAMMQEIMKGSGLGGGVFGFDPESRTEEQYRASIARWEERVREEWREAPDKLAGYALDGVSIRVSNATKVFFHDVEVKIHLEGAVRGIVWRDGSNSYRELDLDLPSPPRSWGPTPRVPFNPGLINPPHYIPTPNFPSTYRSPLDWNNGGSVDLTLDVGDLRPRQTFSSDDDELILVLPLTADAEVHGTWEITARDHNEIYTGELTVLVGPPLELTDAVREFLKLDRPA
ncbi:hypothetical protein ACFPER_05650 [Agromyces aurantiacus]|uniref:ATP-binding protein n=1 Tax=Agromyces aurantiacus TaxID=165814 RepID=A0ABV9R377_9MICO|nr:hypothetical protein [Agromyces aurantiacus]MBM7502942.1 hypothetical protein [Agromyces aurantiacus]